MLTQLWRRLAGYTGTVAGPDGRERYYHRGRVIAVFPVERRTHPGRPPGGRVARPSTAGPPR